MQSLIAVLTGIFVYALILSLISKKTISKSTIRSRIEFLQKQNFRGFQEEDELSKPFYERVVKPLISKLLQAIGKLIPSGNGKNSSAAKQKSLLQQAGWAISVEDYNAIQLMVMVGGAIIGALIGISMAVEFTNMLVYILIGAYASFTILRFIVTSQATQRKQALERQLPDMLDLLSVSVEAGLGFEQALYQITQNMEGPLIDEIAVTYREMSMGRTRKEALVLLGERCDVDDVRAFTSALVQAGQLGISIRNVLKAQSVALRKSRRNKIQEQASKLSTKILFPMLIFIFPVLFIVLLAPAMINIMEFL